METEASVTKIVGENVRKAREATGLSQEELGDKQGIDRTYVSGVERGVRNPRVEVLARARRCAGITRRRPTASIGPRGGCMHGWSCVDAGVETCVKPPSRAALCRAEDRCPPP